MEIYLVPFSLLDLVIMSPIFGYITWVILRKQKKKKRRRNFTGFLTWSFIIHAAVVPVFWILHFTGVWGFVESEQAHFDPVSIAGHEFGFFLIYLLFCGGLTTTILYFVKRKSS